MGQDELVIIGAREHNLKNVSLTIPRNQLVVVTGLSGSGKSSLAFDTLYAEGQRRYVESLSAYARQFLGQMDKPDVDEIRGLSPAISIDQKTTVKNPRSTVGTVTEIYDYMRLLFARVGIPHCPVCGKEIRPQSVDQIADAVMALPQESRIQVLAPLVRARKGEHQKILENVQKNGFVRVRIDGEIYDISETPQLDKQKKHSIEAVVDRLIVREGIESRLTDSLETALRLGDGLVIIQNLAGTEQLYSTSYSCPDCGINMPELTPRMFSFNSPFGACPSCTGLGFLLKVDPNLVINDPHKSLSEGAITASGWNFGSKGSMAHGYGRGLAERYGFSLDTPYGELSEEVQQVILYGSGKEKINVEFVRENGSGKYKLVFEGVIPNMERRYRESNSDWVKAEIEACMTAAPCTDCKGKRLRPETLAVTVGGKNISELCDLSITKLSAFFRQLTLPAKETKIAEQILKEIHARLAFLEQVGLDYLTLSRSSGTLSGGEAQRIRLATQIGSGLVGVLYILDEPSIGLHQRDNEKLLETLKHLRDLGNTLIVVEHDEDTMFAADHIVDVGPGAGVHGGQIIAQGTAEEIMQVPESITGQYLSGKKQIALPQTRRPVTDRKLVIRSASENNLKHIDVEIPLGVITCVTGVSGSGKSSLVNEILYKSAASTLNGAQKKAGAHEGIDGLEELDKVIDIDQAPIGRTPRSNPATYTGLFSDIRNLFASTNDAKERGYGPGRFSFNVSGGRCEACSGDGTLKIEMHFLPDVYVDCEVCGGKRYNRETLEVRYKGKNIAEVLDMTIDEAVVFFENIPKIHNRLKTLQAVGLGYVKLGQPATTLSGGEAQRVKLATELSKRSTGRTLYILDEPTTGLHIADVDRLIGVLQQLCEGGNTVVIIEHNMDVIKISDYLIDLGPEGGERGGRIIGVGTPEELMENEQSYTGQFLKKHLNRLK